MTMHLQEIFKKKIIFKDNIILIEDKDLEIASNQNQTKDIFSDKWKDVDQYKDLEALYQTQFEWFYSLYGFKNEAEVIQFLYNKKYIIDTGCGLGYKAAWFARLAPHATVIGIDISDAMYLAAKNFKQYPNLFFLQRDIADTCIKSNSIDFTLCDQVIMHTEFPEKTFEHLSSITKRGGEFGCYVYSKKALPRELLDDYFRTQTHNISNKEMWEFSEQLTELGKRLSDLKISFDCPDIPVLGIKGGTYDIQRFIYWNFIKCFWKDEWSFELNKCTNYDWYAPSNAKRYTKEEFEAMISQNNLETIYFHQEEACYSGRFKK